MMIGLSGTRLATLLDDCRCVVIAPEELARVRHSLVRGAHVDLVAVLLEVRHYRGQPLAKLVRREEAHPPRKEREGRVEEPVIR